MEPSSGPQEFGKVIYISSIGTNRSRDPCQSLLQGVVGRSDWDFVLFFLEAESTQGSEKQRSLILRNGHFQNKGISQL